MNEEEQEALDYIKEHRDYIKKFCETLNDEGFDTEDTIEETNALKKYNTVINLIERQQKIIDKTVKELSLIGISYWRFELMEQVTPQKPLYDLIKEHFYSEVENERRK